MALDRQRLLAAGCIGVLLAAGLWTGASMTRPDPRARGAWDAAPHVVSPTATDVTLYLPSCDVVAIRIQAAPGQRGALAARVTRGPHVPTGQQVLADASGLVLDDEGRVDVPLTHAPVRERVTLRLASLSGDVPLDTATPFELVLASSSALGRLPCSVDGQAGRTWGLLALGALHLTALGCLVGWLAGGVDSGVASASGLSRVVRPAGAVVVVTTTLLLYLIAVPPFEPPDEFAHLQYARYVAVTGGLPRTVPPPDSEWRSSVYEWVQQPTYYLAAAALLRLSGDAHARPSPVPHPQSRLTGGPDVSLYRHPDRTSEPGALRAIWTLRVLAVLMAMVTVWSTARAVALVTGSATLGAASAAALAVVPQWAAVMGIVSTDPPATMAASVATLWLCHLVQAPGGWGRALLVGSVVGLAYTVKATAVFLVPMLAVALLATTVRVGRHAGLRIAAASLAGLVLASAWVPLRAWLTFGDPLARAFKRDVLEIGGFVVLEGPPIWSAAFVDQWRTMVFEAFWARFGSLGAGPLPGSRVWWVYGLVSVLLSVLAVMGLLRGLQGLARAPRGTDDAARVRQWLLAINVVGVLTGLALWAWVNLVPQADMVVHWTPRHILPLTTPLLVVVASGVQMAGVWAPPVTRPALRIGAGVMLLGLGGAGLAVLRSVLLGFHFGY